MKIYNNLFPLIISPTNLFKAWDVFKSDKRNKPDVIQFELKLEENIFQLYRDLKNGSYKHGVYKGFWIHDPKVRHIHKATVRDRVLHHAIFRMLNPIFEPTFISNSFSCRIGKGTHKGVETLTNMLRKASRNGTQTCYALKCDVRRFFDSVDHKMLFKALEQKIKDEKTLCLLREIISSYSTGSELARERESTALRAKGIPIGNLTSQMFANIYMNEFDQFVKHGLKIKNYIRYTDDFIIIFQNEDYLKQIIPILQNFLSENLKLELHPNKITIKKFHQGVDFLGYVNFPHHRLLRTKTKKRILRKIKKNIQYFEEGSLSKKTLDSSFNSYLGVLSHADGYKLTENLKNNFWFWRDKI